jgi:hypothetical protein
MSGLLQFLQARAPGGQAWAAFGWPHLSARLSFALDCVLIDDRCDNVSLRIELEWVTVMQ